MSEAYVLSPIRESYWVIPGRFKAGESPGAVTQDEIRQKLRWLLHEGANQIIDLTEQGEPGLQPYDRLLNDEASRYSLVANHLRMPLADFSTPAIETVVEILDEIDLALSVGKNIYLHCHAGRGRTGTIVGCYLVRQGLPGKKALYRIQELRKDTPSWDVQSPETQGQIRMVLEWKKGQ